MVFIGKLKKTIRGEEDDDDDRMLLGRYEIGRTLGQGNFGKVKYAKDIQTEHSVALKIIDKTSIKNTQNSDQITREISTLKLLKHPNVVRLHEVLASKTKIYMVLEYVTGGELFDTVASNGKLPEPKVRKFFQQLIDGVSYCHKKGVFHRDLKLENVLVDAKGNIKISDFGLGALPQQFRDDGLLHTTCGSPNYVAPEVLSNRGYDGAASDTWSCGVILYVMLTGYLPFDDRNLAVLYQKIFNGDVQMPKWMSLGAKSLIKRILDPNPKTRITMTDIKADEWFKQDYTPSKPTEEEEDEGEDEDEDEEKNLDIDDEVLSVQEENSTDTKSPTHINAFQLIGMSRCLDLSGFFEKEDVSERKVRFTSTLSQKELLERVHSTVTHMGFGVEKQNQKLKIVQECKGHSKSGHLSATAEVFEVTTSLYVVEIRKISGEAIVYRQLCDKLLKDFGISPNQEHLATSLLEAS